MTTRIIVGLMKPLRHNETYINYFKIGTTIYTHEVTPAYFAAFRALYYDRLRGDSENTDRLYASVTRIRAQQNGASARERSLLYAYAIVQDYQTKPLYFDIVIDQRSGSQSVNCTPHKSLIHGADPSINL